MFWFRSSLEEKLAGLRARRDELHQMFKNVEKVHTYYIDENLELTQKIAELEYRLAKRTAP